MLAQQVNAPSMTFVGPKQFYGLELSVFAVELTSMVVWIGYLQWSLTNGPGNFQTPILEILDNIVLHDALMNDDGSEYAWPEADFIIGNPPFIGNKRMRIELGSAYVTRLRQLFTDRLPKTVDYVCYWFEKARARIDSGASHRAGLIATNSITQSRNRVVLDRITSGSGIFMAWPDQPWVLEGASVRVSIVGFGVHGSGDCTLSGATVDRINSNLTASLALSLAQRLPGKSQLVFEGISPAGQFDVGEMVAQTWLDLPNPSGASNHAVLKRYVVAKDILGRDLHRWIVDFGNMSESEARRYVVPFDYIEQAVKPGRADNPRKARRDRWWIFGESRPAMREALAPLARFIATPKTSKHRVFVWLPSGTLPSSLLAVFA